MPRLRIRYSILSIAVFTLVFGGIGMISLDAGSFPSRVQAVESEDEEARPDANCFLFNNEWICVSKLSTSAQLTPEQSEFGAPVVASLQALSSEPLPGGGRPSM
ncbi:hypothetical protein BH23CHL2_BH23CHL2_08350 [soil metagenome]